MTVNFEVKVVGDNLERALKKLKSKGLKAGLFRELRDRKHYRKPSEIKIEKKKEQVANHKKNKRIKMRNM